MHEQYDNKYRRGNNYLNFNLGKLLLKFKVFGQVLNIIYWYIGKIVGSKWKIRMMIEYQFRDCICTCKNTSLYTFEYSLKQG